MKRCTRCVLPETFPGIRFDEAGVCQYCRRALPPERLAAQKAKLLSRFEKLALEARERPGYDCIMAWSGGKDSTYTLWLLKEKYGLNPLAFTFDNGFISPLAIKNVRVVSETLGVDLIIAKPRFDLLREVFAESLDSSLYPTKALERATGICNACMAIAKGIGWRLALQHQAPMVIYGWSPGQLPISSALFRLNARLLKSMVASSMEPLLKIAGDAVLTYAPSDAMITQAEQMPYNIAPLAFVDYTEEMAIAQIKELGWERPQDTDPNSTNCLLNSYAIKHHKQQLGFHPYAMELAGLVREGYMSREEALARLATAPAPAVVAAVQAKLKDLET